MLTTHVTINVVACLMDLAFVIDYSGSIRDSNDKNADNADNWQFIVDFMVEAIRLFNVGESGTHVGAVSFGMTTLFELISSQVTLR